jgi:hypothetical protein
MFAGKTYTFTRRICTFAGKPYTFQRETYVSDRISCMLPRETHTFAIGTCRFGA